MTEVKPSNIETQTIPLALVSPNATILHTKLEDFDFNTAAVNPEDLAEILYTIMEYNGGLGLSANQVGLPYRMFVMRSEPRLAVFNPKIVALKGEIALDEGCLSYPGLFLKIKRAAHVRARFQTPNGQTTTRVFEGISARVFLHEYDHLEGKDFTQLVSRQRLELAKSKAAKMKKQGRQQYLKFNAL